MKADIRVDADFIGNPKTQRVIREMGDKVITSLLSLWGFAAKHRTKGILRGLSPEEIGEVARWDGDPKQFVSSLVWLRWLEKRGKVYSIHEWEIHQTYAFFADERSQAARKAAETRWKKQRGDDASRMRSGYGQHPPVPDPTPTPIPVPPPRTRDAFPLPPSGGGGAAASTKNNSGNPISTPSGKESLENRESAITHAIVRIDRKEWSPAQAVEWLVNRYGFTSEQAYAALGVGVAG
jgi:hypothetical protein